MTVPHWELLHSWAIEDIQFELEQIWELKKMLRKHPDDTFGETFRGFIKMCKKRLDMEIRRYQKIYGGRPNIRKLRMEMEGE